MDSTSSPMVLDETIKIQHKVEFSEEEEEEEEVAADEESSEKYEDTTEDAKQKAAHDAREDILKNCLEYKSDILNYMRRLEHEHRPKAGYMKKQADITGSMRAILIDWLVEVSEEYRLHPETLYLAVNYTDRFLSQMSVLRGKLQLVGTASMYVAAKYEEITPPDVSEFVFITDDTYSKKQVRSFLVTISRVWIVAKKIECLVEASVKVFGVFVKILDPILVLQWLTFQCLY